MTSPRSNPIRQQLTVAALALAASGVTFILVLMAAGWPLDRTNGTSIPASGASSATPQPTPLVRYVAVDPALIPTYEAAHPRDRAVGFLSREIPPVGVYLPTGGTQQFELPSATPSATPSPTLTTTPTMTPTPTPTMTPTATLTLTPRATRTSTATASPTPLPTTTLVARFTPAPVALLPLPGADCAPAGLPVAGLVTRAFSRWHGGIDIAVDNNTPVRVTHSGSVIFAGWRTDGYGNLIVVQNGRFTTYYGHLRDITVHQGEWVVRGATIGTAGSTGNSTGPHVHYETRLDDVPVDPQTFDQRGFTPC